MKYVLNMWLFSKLTPKPNHWYFLQPHNHGKKVAKFYYATPELVNKAIDTSLQAKKEWEKIPLDDRLQFFLKIADLMAGKYRAELNATTMLGQAKTVIQVRWNPLNLNFCPSKWDKIVIFYNFEKKSDNSFYFL